MKKELIKIVVPGDGDYLKNRVGGGGKWKPLRKVTQGLRKSLARQVDDIRAAFAASFERWKVPAVAVVQLHDKAIAKTKRPSLLFNSLTCPVIGCGRLGELRVSVTPRGLAALKNRILNYSGDRAEAHLSTVEQIQPFDVSHNYNDTVLDADTLRLRLFRHRTQTDNVALAQAVREIAGPKSIEELRYADNISMLKVRAKTKDSIVTLQSFIGTQSLATFPTYHVADVASTQIGTVTAALCPAPDPNGLHAILGVFDSGGSPNATHILPWIHDRHSWFPPEDQDNEHGTFVIGLACNAHLLNHRDPRIPNCSARIVDYVVFDKTNSVSEETLLDLIDDALVRYPYVRVWNLSLSQPNVVCCDHEFSPLAIALDHRARKHNVLFVVTGGNLPPTAPPRAWPPQEGVYYGDDEKFCAPGDSLRSLPVGGLAHRDTPSTVARSGDPSPIARRGPGACYKISPLVAGWSGNCDEHGNFAQSGVVSVNAAGNLAESIGVSFGIPPVSTLMATVEQAVRHGGNNSSVLLAKAMLLHTAFLKNAPLDEHLLNYQGFGPVPSLEDVLYCEQAAPTVVFEVNFQDLPKLCKRAFPLPESAIKGDDVHCEMLMTLLYDPPLDGEYTVEYVRSNVDAQLGFRDAETGKFETCVDPHLKFFARGYEKSLIKYGFKWSPVKLFYTNFYDLPGNALAHRPWELRMRVFRRAEYTTVENQTAFLFVTLRDKTGAALLYDEWIRQMNLQAWQTKDLRLDARLRLNQ